MYVFPTWFLNVDKTDKTDMRSRFTGVHTLRLSK